MRSAIRIALLYAILSGIYIFASDRIALALAQRDPDLITRWQSFKGLAFVAGSALIIFFLLLHYVRSRDRAAGLMEQARKSFEDLFQRNPLPLIVYDLLELKILAVNQAASESYGYAPGEFLRLTVRDLHPPEDLEKILAHVARIKPYPYVGHWRHRRKDGTAAEVEIISHPMVFNRHEARLIVSVDISRQKMAEQALTETLAARTEAEEAKTQFLATVSHEMRTPLNAVNGFLDLLGREEDLERRREYIHLSRQGAADLLSLIERMINAAALTANVARKDETEIDVKSFLRNITDSFFHPARRKGIKLDVVLEEDLPGYARLDAERLAETLKILLDNAIKFSHGGTVTLRAWQEAAGAKQRFKIAVSDQGIGIPPGQQARVFDSFFQVDRELSRKYGGVGMGLFVAKQLCDLIGATLEMESSEAVGSVFTVTLTGQTDESGLFLAGHDGNTLS